MNKQIPWHLPFTGEEEKNLVCKVIDDQFLNDGAYTRAFEKMFCEYTGAKYAVGVTSGTASIVVALLACGIEPGDEVIVPDFMFIATANAVRLIGAKPVFVDINQHDFSIDAGQIEKQITKKTKAIIPVHINGRRADMEAINRIAQTHGISVIEDAAQALGSFWNGRHLGTEGIVGCFSFAPTKIITTGQGGMAVTNKESVYRRMVELKDQGRFHRGTGGDDLHPVLGYNFKLTNLQAAVGVAQMERLPGRVARIREVFTLYEAMLKDLKGFLIVPIKIEKGISPQWVDALCDDRNELVAYLSQREIGTRNFWFSIHSQAPYQHSGDFPNATHVSRRGLWLPCDCRITDEEIVYVCEEIRKFYLS